MHVLSHEEANSTVSRWDKALLLRANTCVRKGRAGGERGWPGKGPASAWSHEPGDSGGAGFNRSPPGTSEHQHRLRKPPRCQDLCSGARPTAEPPPAPPAPRRPGAAAPSAPRPGAALAQAECPARVPMGPAPAGTRQHRGASPDTGTWQHHGASPDTGTQPHASGTTRGLQTSSRAWRWELSGHHKIWWFSIKFHRKLVSPLTKT